MRTLPILIASLSIAGCAKVIPVISSFDGKPVSQVDEQRYRAECDAKSKVATAGVPHQVFGDKYGINRAAEQADVRKAAFEGCMAEKGLKVTWVKDAA